MKKFGIRFLVVACSLSWQGAHAGLITSQGSVSALTNISQITSTVLGTADFEAVASGYIPATTYAGTGVTFLEGAFAGGYATLPLVQTNAVYFPAPTAGGGSQGGNYAYHAGVAVFGTGMFVTQFGLTASRNGTQYVTAWDRLGNMIGQVTWAPSGDSSFVGLDSGATQIGMIAYGNDDLYNGGIYGVGGLTIMSDNWIWAGRSEATNMPSPGTLALFGLGFAGLGWSRRKRA